MRDVLEVVALHQDSSVHCGRHTVQAVVQVVVVEHVHRVAEPHPRVALLGAVEEVVVVAHPKVASVLGEGVGVAQQHGLAVVVEVVPGHRDKVRLPLDVEQPVEPVGEVVVIDPDVVRRVRHADRVVGRVAELDVSDDHVVARSGGRAHLQATAGDLRGGADPDDALVGHHRDHVVEGDPAGDHDGERRVHAGVAREVGRVGDGHGRAGGAAGGSVLAERVHAGEADRTVGQR
jgi:hypothetical protein